MTLVHSTIDHTYDDYAISLLDAFDQNLHITDPDTHDSASWTSVGQFDIFDTGIGNNKLFASVSQRDHTGDVPKDEPAYQLQLYNSNVQLTTAVHANTKQLIVAPNKSKLTTRDQPTKQRTDALSHILTWKSKQPQHSSSIWLSELQRHQYAQFTQHHFGQLIKSAGQAEGCVTVHELATSAMYALQGVESNCFQYDTLSYTCSVSGYVTQTYNQHHCVHNMLNAFAQAATVYSRVESVVLYIQQNYKLHGSITLSFGNALSTWLSTYRAKLLKLHSPSLTLLQLYTSTEQLIQQLTAIYGLVLQQRALADFGTAHVVQKLPRKTHMITYLYNTCLTLATHDTYGVYDSVQYMFHCTLTAYTNILANWLYYGKRIDPHNEFINPPSTNSNATLLNVPAFMQSMTDVLFLTGQSLYVMSHANTQLFYSCAINTPDTNATITGTSLLQLQYTHDDIQQQAAHRSVVKQQQESALTEYMVQLRDDIQLQVERSVAAAQLTLQRQRHNQSGTNVDAQLQVRQQLARQQLYLQQLNDQIAVSTALKQAEQQQRDDADQRAAELHRLDQQIKLAREQEQLLLEHNAFMEAETKKQRLIDWRAKRLALRAKRNDVLQNDEAGDELHTESHVQTVDADDIELLDNTDDMPAQPSVTTILINETQAETAMQQLQLPSPQPGAEGRANRNTQTRSNIFNVTESPAGTATSVAQRSIDKAYNSSKQSTTATFSTAATPSATVKRLSPLDAARQAVAAVSHRKAEPAALDTPAQTDISDNNVVSVDVEHTTLSRPSLYNVIQQTLVASVYAQYESVNRAVLTLYNTQLQLHHHITTCRAYLMWAHGDVMQYVCGELCDLTRNANIYTLSPSTLRFVVDDALRHCNIASNQYTDALYFKHDKPVNKKPIQTHPLHSLNGLQLCYRAQWPVSLVLTDESITQYSRVCSLLMRMQRVHSQLSDTFKQFQTAEKQIHAHNAHRTTLRRELQRDRVDVGSPTHNRNNTADLTADKQAMHQHAHRLRVLQTARHEMQHLHSVIAEYTMHQMLERCWIQYNASSGNARNLRDLCTIHDTYVESILRHCFLHTSTLQLSNILDTVMCDIYDFCVECSAVDLTPAGALAVHSHVYDQLAVRAARFRQTTSFLYTVLRDLVQQNESVQDVSELLLRFDFSGYYQLQDAERLNSDYV